MLGRRSACAWVIVAMTIVAACDRLPTAAANQQGGAYLILDVDATTLRRRQLENVADLMASRLREAMPAIRYSGRGVLNDTARVRLVDQADLERARATLRGLASSPETGMEIFTFTVAEDGVIEAHLTPSYLRDLSRQAAEQSIEVIRRRVDPTGMGGVEIARQGDLRIFVRAPRVMDPSQLRQSVGITGLLTFHLVREVSPEDGAAGHLPPGTMLVQPYPGIGATAEVVERRPRFTGERLARANPQTDPVTGEFVLSFQLDAHGTRIFCRITRDYTGQRFAVLLDNQVLTAPRINEPICGGAGQISGNFTGESASELAVLLNAGALPAPLIVVEEGVMPPG
jgi:protein-export membrane protein SecD